MIVRGVELTATMRTMELAAKIYASNLFLKLLSCAVVFAIPYLLISLFNCELYSYYYYFIEESTIARWSFHFESLQLLNLSCTITKLSLKEGNELW